MKEDGMIDNNKVIDRLLYALDLKRDKELADKIERAPSTISAWRKRENINFNLLIEKFPDISLDHLLYGTMPVFRDNDINNVIIELLNHSEKHSIDPNRFHKVMKEQLDSLATQVQKIRELERLFIEKMSH